MMASPALLASSIDHAWRAERLAMVPDQWAGRVRSIHERKLALREHEPAGRGHHTDIERWANRWLTDLSEGMRRYSLPVGATDDDIRAMAARLARECLDMAGNAWIKTSGAIVARLAAFCGLYGIRAPECDEAGPAIARMTDAAWWLRGLRVAQARALEGAAIDLGYVHRRDQIYASTATVERRGQQRRRNALMLETTTAKNADTGQEFTLAELAERSVANPKIRQGELMTRIRGFEGVAAGVGDVGEFVTLTCPSRFHAMTQQGARVVANPRHDGSKPRDAQKYLCRVWALIRAKLARLGIRPYGFRVAEPHHDGTPHWHLLLFVSPDVVDEFRAVFRAYALRDSGDEPGAAANRVKFVRIDERGTAAGYIAKYIAKNIDGGTYQVQGDIEGPGSDAIYPGARVEAWASTWGIRQFQQIGGPPVGLWRELRRSEAQETASEVYEQARSAADVGNWARYVEVLGGVMVERRNLRLRVAYTREGERWDFKNAMPCPAPVTRYGEVAKASIFGVADVSRGAAYPSRRYSWEIRRAVGVVSAGWEMAVTAVQRAAAKFRGGLEGLCPSRTRVNNCTEEVGNGRSGRGVEIASQSDERVVESDGGDDTGQGARHDRGTGESCRADGGGGREDGA